MHSFRSFLSFMIFSIDSNVSLNSAFFAFFTLSLHKAHKTPGLRNALLTAPYMHDGSKASLEDVIEFYNRGGDRKQGISNLIKPLNLTPEEKRDLIAFMGALTDPIEIERPDIP